jgi:hypothetical protein
VVWLERNLAAAGQVNRKVWLMFHIPPGIDGYATAMKGREQFPSGRLVEISGAARDSSIVAMYPEWTSQFDSLLAKIFHHGSRRICG